MNAIGKRFWKPRHIALSDQTGSNQEPQVAWKPLTRASDHTLKLPVSPQLLAARCGMTTGGGGCSALCSQKGAVEARN